MHFPLNTKEKKFNHSKGKRNGMKEGQQKEKTATKEKNKPSHL
jgi:hypothetical protein